MRFDQLKIPLCLLICRRKRTREYFVSLARSCSDEPVLTCLSQYRNIPRIFWCSWAPTSTWPVNSVTADIAHATAAFCDFETGNLSQSERLAQDEITRAQVSSARSKRRVSMTISMRVADFCKFAADASINARAMASRINPVVKSFSLCFTAGCRFVSGARIQSRKIARYRHCPEGTLQRRAGFARSIPDQLSGAMIWRYLMSCFWPARRAHQGFPRAGQYAYGAQRLRSRDQRL